MLRELTQDDPDQHKIKVQVIGREGYLDWPKKFIFIFKK
jgi:hypothetical protein